MNAGRFYEAGRPVPIRKQIAERSGDSALRCGDNDVDAVAQRCRPTDRTVTTECRRGKECDAEEGTRASVPVKRLVGLSAEESYECHQT